MRAIPAVLALAVVLAGCSGDGDGTSSTTPGPSGTGTTGPTGTATTTGPAPESNRPPTGSLAASVPGGAVPLNVTFTLGAEDPDGDELWWSLDADGNGNDDAGADFPATFPATASFVYTAPGRYNATYRISDGASSIAYQAVVDVTGDLATQMVTGSWQASSAGCGGPYDTWAFGTPGSGVAWMEFDVDAATIGRPYHMEFESDSVATVVGVDFYTADGMTSVGGKFDTAPFDDVVPAGAVKGLVSDCGGLNLTFTYQTA